MSKVVAYVHSKGDPSVGINGNDAEVIMDYEFIDDEEREDARKEIAKCFSKIWGYEATVMFADETTGNDLEDL